MGSVLTEIAVDAVELGCAQLEATDEGVEIGDARGAKPTLVFVLWRRVS